MDNIDTLKAIEHLRQLSAEKGARGIAIDPDPMNFGEKRVTNYQYSVVLSSGVRCSLDVNWQTETHVNVWRPWPEGQMSREMYDDDNGDFVSPEDRGDWVFGVLLRDVQSDDIMITF